MGLEVVCKGGNDGAECSREPGTDGGEDADLIRGEV